MSFYCILALVVPGTTADNKTVSAISSSEASSGSTKQADVNQAAESALDRNGWSINDYAIGSKTSSTNDKSKTGNDSFSNKMTSKNQLSSFITSGTNKATIFVKDVAATTYSKTYTNGSDTTQSSLEREVTRPR